MYIMVIGLRGFPDIQGGIETHCEQLYPRLCSLGARVEVITRSTYWGADKPETFGGATLTSIWTPRSRTLETVVHSFLAVLYATFKRPDILHMHAIGPALFAPLARLVGLKVVVTHHGPDYDREKWSRLAKLILRVGEKFGMRFSNQRIVISETIRALVKAKHQRDSVLIPNGVPEAAPIATHDWLDSMGVVPGKFILQVSRLVPEKRQLDLIRAFELSAAQAQRWHLLLAGALDSDSNFQNALRDAARVNPQVVLTDFQTGDVLREMLTHAGAFVLPSSHEGLPIALLEALSYSLRVFASDIPANLEVPLDSEQFFPLGDVDSLAALLSQSVKTEWCKADRQRALAIAKTFDWDLIAADTLEVYKQVLSKAA